MTKSQICDLLTAFIADIEVLELFPFYTQKSNVILLSLSPNVDTVAADSNLLKM